MSNTLHTESSEDELFFLFEAIAQHPACGEFVENSDRDLSDIYDTVWSGCVSAARAEIQSHKDLDPTMPEPHS